MSNESRVRDLAGDVDRLQARLLECHNAIRKYIAAWNDFAITMPGTAASRLGGDDCDEALVQLALVLPENRHGIKAVNQ